ncbi:SDR family NAD(P)-dependent oxidoreductase [Embleya sp. NPDC055664]
MRHRRIPVTYASHSPHVEPLHQQILTDLAPITPRPTTIPLYSTVTTTPIDGTHLTPQHWYTNLRTTVRFQESIETLLTDEHTLFIETSPHPVLTTPIEDTIHERSVRARTVATLRRDHGDLHRWHTALAHAFVAGRTPTRLAAPPPRDQLPTYPFRHETFWLASARHEHTAGSGQRAATHPLLDASMELADGAALLLTGRLSLATHPWLADHAVHDTVLLPGTAFLDLALHAAGLSGCSTIEELTLEAPLPLPEHHALHLQISVGAPDEHQRRALSVYSRPETHDPEGSIGSDRSDSPSVAWTRHATATLGIESWIEPAPTTERRPAGAVAVDIDNAYADFAEQGYHYGPTFQGLTALWRDGDDLYAEIRLPDDADPTGHAIHPALLDAALHPLLLAEAGAEEIRLPFTFGGIRLSPDFVRGTHAHAHITATGDHEHAITLTDDAGRRVATVATVTTRPISRAQLAISTARSNESLHRLDWHPYPTRADTPPDTAGWAVLGTPEDIGAIPALAALDLPAHPDVPSALRAGAGTLLVAAPRVMPQEPALPAAAFRATALILRGLQDRLAVDDSRASSARLVVVTSRAVPTHHGDPLTNLAQAPLWGLVRSAQAEHPDLFAIVDTDPHADPGLLAAAIAAGATDGQPQLAIRHRQILAPRLVRHTSPLAVPSGPTPWRLEVPRPGGFDGLALVPAPELTRPLGPGEVRLAPAAVGLNFRDTLITLGLYPGERPHVGGEGAGTVLEVGPGVPNVRPGDRVMGLLEHGTASVTITDHRLLMPVPDDWSDAQAAAVPVAFATAYHALHDLAALRRGKRLLIHTATGGVGQAAGQLARYIGAEVYATASRSKHETLAELGYPADRVADSRTHDYADRFLTATDGAGLDVVLHSLADEHTDTTLRLLPRGGRFIDMGKADIRDGAEVAARHPGVEYRAFDLTDAGFDRIGRIFAVLARLFANGSLRPLPTTGWHVTHAPQALRHLSQGHHTGKLTLTLPRGIDPDGTILITGGTGTLGALTARHLVTAHGARHLILTNRSGNTPQTQALHNELTELGAHVTITPTDATNPQQTDTLLASIDPAHPLTAIFHTAGTLADATLANQTTQHLDTVLPPKIDAAWHLHEGTRHLRPAPTLVLYSSAAATLGSAGQANYAAANAFLDALAHHRHSQGHPTVSLAWGPWQETSNLTAGLGAADHQRHRAHGITPLTTPHALGLLDTALRTPHPTLAPINLGQHRSERGTRTPARTATPTTKLVGLSEAEQTRTLLELVRTQVAQILGHATPEAVDADRPFKDLGFDSLTAVELRNLVNNATGLRLPSSLVFDHPTPARLAAFLRTQLADAEPTAATAAPASAPTPSAAVVSGGSEEPIAIVGMGCRFPGDVRGPADLWRLITDRTDAISVLPENRGWDTARLHDPDPDATGHTYAREGGFLHDAGDFDAVFFGISPREAAAMDPQQRLLLETAWETFENARLDPTAPAVRNTGVFTGVVAQNYADNPAPHHARNLEGYLATGTTTSVASGRIAYTLGLEGPAITVDTACSSSLVAIHLASQALRNGECDLALAGGVTVMSTPTPFLEFSRQRGLAPDGRCKPFAADANGFALAEGVGLVLLEPLSRARDNGHTVLAVIRGSAINQDGASNGLTAPNGPSQQRVIRSALTNAGLTADQVDAVEAHGTGTTLGDPIEAQALLATYGQHRDPERPLWLGSVKSNIGHTQAAAGIAGVIKMVQALRHETLPATLHVDEPTPHVDWDTGAVSLLTEARPWPRTPDRPRRAAVSSFGISGTNAHLVLEQGDPTPNEATDHEVPSGPAVIALSAKDDHALRAHAERLRAHLVERPETTPAALAAALRTRSVFDHRATIVTDDSDELVAALGALAADASHPALDRDVARPGKTVFVFPGQGAQWVGMGARLLDTSPVFAEHLNACAQALAPYVDWNLVDVVTGAEQAPSLDRVDVVQPALWAMMISLARLWEHHGIHPDAVIGHSQGEIAAAHIAGALTLHDSARIIALRSQAITTLTTHGGMLSIAQPPHTIRQLLTHHPHLTIAALNGPHSTVISGNHQELDQLQAHCETHDIHARRIPVTYASHSPDVEPLRQQILTDLAPITPRPTTIPLYSAVTTTPIAGTHLTPEHWYTNLRTTVRFQETVEAQLRDGYTHFIETSPHPVLTAAILEIIDENTAEDTNSAKGTPVPATVQGTLTRDEDTPARVHTALARAFATGLLPEWPPSAATLAADVPTYPFRPETYWVEAGHTRADAGGLGQLASPHPLLGAAVELADGDGLVLTGRLSLATHPWLADHAVHDTVLLPGAAFLDLALHTIGLLDGRHDLEDLVLHAPLALFEQQAIHLQLSVGAPDESGHRTLAIHSRPESADPDTAPGAWTRHAGATVTPAGGRATADRTMGGAWPPVGAKPVDLLDRYADFARQGYRYGPLFQGLTALWRDGDDLYAEIRLPDDADPTGHTIHPALLDAAFQPLAAVFADGRDLHLPFAFGGVRHTPGAGTVVRARLSRTGSNTFSVTVTDPDGAHFLDIETLTTRVIGPEQLAALDHRPAKGLHVVRWEPYDAGNSPAEATNPVVLAEPGHWLATALAAAGHDVVTHPHLDALNAAIRAGAPVPAVVLVPADGPAVDPAAEEASGMDVPQAARYAVERALALTREWPAQPAYERSRLVFVTRDAVATGPEDLLDNLAHAPLWGLLRSAHSEHPGSFGMVDVDGGGGPSAPQALASAVTAAEPELAIRANRLLAPTLTAYAPAGAEEEENSSLTIDPEGTVLITGGTGTLGSLTARHLITRHGARHLVLTSRTGGTPETDTIVAELGELGAEVAVVRADASDPSRMAELFDGIDPAHPLTAIFHAAGTLADAALTNQTSEHLDIVLPPKIDAAWHLHTLGARLSPAPALILYSSAAATFGSPGQANYAAANTFLDALAHHRHARGLPGTSLAWGPWQQTSNLTAALTAVDHERHRDQGVVPLATPHALTLLSSALAAPLPALTVIDLRRRTVAQPTPRRRAYAELPAEERRKALLDLVRDTVASVSGRGGGGHEEIDDRQFKDLGFDSMTAVELRNRLGAATGLRLPATLVFDHATPFAVARFLDERLAEGLDDDGASPTSALLADLDRFHAAVAGLTAEDRTRGEAVVRLREILRSLDDAHDVTDPQAPDLDTEIETASAEGILDLIDRRFGAL